MTTETPKWRVTFTPDSPRRTVEAYIDHADALALRLPGVAVIFDPRADDVGPQGLADYLNTLEARAALADLLRPCFIVNNGRVVELSMPHTVMDEFVRRYDALTQCTQEVGR